MSARILVIGGGSIGRRHANNLGRLGADVTVIDVEMGPNVPEGYDGIVVASPTRLHAGHATAVLATGAAVFVEKPMACSLEEGVELVSIGGDRLMVGYNLRYHVALRRLADLISDGHCGRPCAFRLWFGQWLPDWRPNVDYRETYSARAGLGGGILADASHELDLAVWFAGEELEVVGAVVTRLGPLEVDVEDTVRALLRSASGAPVSIELDCLARQYRRGIEVVGDLATVGYDWSTQLLTVRRAAETSTEAFAVDINDTYVAEMVDFLALTTSGEHPGINSGSAGLASLRLVDAIRAQP